MLFLYVFYTDGVILTALRLVYFHEASLGASPCQHLRIPVILSPAAPSCEVGMFIPPVLENLGGCSEASKIYTVG